MVFKGEVEPMADLKVSIPLTPSGETYSVGEWGGGNYREEAKLADKKQQKKTRLRERDPKKHVRKRQDFRI